METRADSPLDHELSSSVKSNQSVRKTKKHKVRQKFLMKEPANEVAFIFLFLITG